jgi:hypothetical protein
MNLNNKKKVIVIPDRVLSLIHTRSRAREKCHALHGVEFL